MQCPVLSVALEIKFVLNYCLESFIYRRVHCAGFSDIVRVNLALDIFFLISQPKLLKFGLQIQKLEA